LQQRRSRSIERLFRCPRFPNQRFADKRVPNQEIGNEGETLFRAAWIARRHSPSNWRSCCYRRVANRRFEDKRVTNLEIRNEGGKAGSSSLMTGSPASETGSPASETGSPATETCSFSLRTGVPLVKNRQKRPNPPKHAPHFAFLRKPDETSCCHP